MLLVATILVLGFCAWTTAGDPKVVPTPNWLFIRGDANIDGAVDIGDMMDSLGFLFAVPGYEDPHCLAAHDANDDGVVDVGDVIYTATYLFMGGPRPPVPFPGCGFDPTRPASGDWLPCNDFFVCNPRR
jgi:hypothetical protein